MKKIVLISILAIIVGNAFGQKAVRKNMREGNKAYKEQRYGAAEDKYKAAIEANPALKEAPYNLANTYYRQQHWDEALKEYQHYLMLENKNPQKMSGTWSNIGNTYLKKKANEKAEGMGTQMLQPGQAPAPQQQAQQVDNLKMSMEAYKNALRLNPNDDDTRYNLAVVQKMLKDREDQEQDQNQDQNQDQQDQNQDQNKDQDQQQNKDQDNKQDQNQDQQQKENQMSQENIQQILNAIEQDEKETQERVKQMKAQERNKQNENNRRHNKDW